MIINFTKLLLTLSLLSNNFVIAQTPAPPQSETIALWGGTAHIGIGSVIENCFIQFENGKITIISQTTKIKLDTLKIKLIDVTGKQIYPGLIALNTRLGINEIDMARATLDKNETGEYNPHVRTIIAYNTDSKIIPTVRSNGVLLAEIAPEGGMISGTSSVVELDAWNWEDAAYKTDVAIHAGWPSSFFTSGWWAEPGSTQKAQNEKKLMVVKQFYQDAYSYFIAKKNGKVENTNQIFESMYGLFDGSKKLFLHTDFSKDIISSVNFFKIFNITPVIIGGKDSYLCLEFLKENNISVVLDLVHRLPNREDEDIDMPYKLPKILLDFGILVAISCTNAWEQRNLMFNAGTAAGYGLTKEQAIQSITCNPAKILGIDKTVGTLETGKDATLIVSDGDIMDMKESNVRYAFIRGKQIDLRNKQVELYEKYMKKYLK